MKKTLLLNFVLSSLAFASFGQNVENPTAPVSIIDATPVKVIKKETKVISKKAGPYDLGIDTAKSNQPYYSTPVIQVTPRTFTAEVSLDEDQTASNVKTKFQVFKGATSVFFDVPTLATMEPGTETLNSTSYTFFNGADTYTTVVTTSADQTDPDLSNNIDSILLVVSDSVFATENGVVNGSLGIGAGSPGVVGNQYALAVNDDISSITFRLVLPTVGDTVVGVVYDMLNGTPNQIVGTTDTLFVTSGASADYTLHLVGGPKALNAGDYIVGLIESTTNNVRLATNDKYYTPGLAWAFFQGSWLNIENIGTGFFRTYQCRANLLSRNASIKENNLINSLSVYPVPASDLMTVGNLTSGEAFKLELLNSLGQVVKTVNSNGLESTQINLSDVIDGFYLLRVSNSVVNGTRSVIVKH
jgi:hypothetical protein